jgi:hypothetical protein
MCENEVAGGAGEETGGVNGEAGVEEGVGVGEEEDWAEEATDGRVCSVSLRMR